jgi:predicted acylesterase/phospholipase RssA
MSSTSIEEVLRQERLQVETARALRLDNIPQRASAEKSLIGLAFSGGGIRSATFNLGVLQALGQARLLRTLDYISTVSGGGYIGGWLMAWMHHQKIGIKEVEARLSTEAYSVAKAADPPEVHFLRNYSNYLTPRKGILGADFWAFATSYLRNTILNLTILVLLLLSLLLLPRSIAYLPHLLEAAEDLWDWQIPIIHQTLTAQLFAGTLGFLLVGLGVIFMGLNMFWVDSLAVKKYPWFTQQWAIQIFIVIPLMLSAALFSYALGHLFLDWGILAHPLWAPSLLAMGMYLGMWLGAFVVRWVAVAKKGRQGHAGPNATLVLTTAAITGFIIGYLFIPFARILIRPGTPSAPETTYSLWHVLTLGTPLFVGIMLLAAVLHIGLMGHGMGDSHREWWGRLGGWLVLYSLGWFLLFSTAVYVPYHLARISSPQGHKSITAGTAIWFISTLYGVLFGKSKSTGKIDPDAPARKKILGYAARLTPYVFIVGLLFALSLLAAKIALAMPHDPTPLWQMPGDIVDLTVPIACIGFTMIAFLLSCRVEINGFSIHHLYRNRLVRCYLGASVRDRIAQPFTGLAESDDFPLADLQIPPGSTQQKYGRPLPILNTSLNVVRGKELALQTRKARSFAFTPLYAGFTREEVNGDTWQSAYRPTIESGSKRPECPEGISLGTAIAISGAAASPNMGSYSQPALAFLMTLFDVRLGWWIANPIRKKQWINGSPEVGFYWLLRELMGSTNDDSNYVYLSDGGHFENLAIYELVRRGCKLIIASDASCDSDAGCSDLHNAVERCRADFGVEIEVDTSSLKSQNGMAANHFVVGKIHYMPGSPQEDGVIVYIKPTLVVGDPADVIGYVAKNPQFPNDTTANQWFDEAHFESYRALGHAAGQAAAFTIAQEVDRMMEQNLELLSTG